MRKVAIFDIDGTFFRSSLLIELIEGLIAEKTLPESTRHIFARPRAKWLDREGAYETYIDAVIRAFDSALKSISREDFLRIGNHIAKDHGKRVYRYTRDLIRDLRKRGYFILAVSHSPKMVLDPFCRRWGFDKVYGRMYEFDAKGKLTGKSEHNKLIDDKGKILLRALEKEKLSLRGSVGVGDSEADIRFLRLVDRPVCFNPNSKLYAVARRRGWEIVVERKDVVYRI